MTIRPSTFSDIPAIVEIIIDAHKRSIYADVCEVHVPTTKALLVRAIQRHGRASAGGSVVFVAERDGKVEGFIVGLLEPILGIGTKLYATDMFFLCSPRVDPRDPPRLVDALVTWAKSAPDCIQITMGVTDVVSDEPERAGRLLQRKGMRRSGAMFSMEVNR